MKQTVTIYGASDDLVEVCGDVPGCDEYGSFDSDKYVEFSTGDVVHVAYDGTWTTTHHVVSGKLKVNIHQCDHSDDNDGDYTDQMELTGNIKWVRAWDRWPYESDDIRDKVEQTLSNLEMRDLDEIATQELFELFHKHSLLARC